MTGEGVEAIIIMLVIVFAIFHMVKKKSQSDLDEYFKGSPESDDKESESKN
ncbi:hypothetical protein [Maridesulfovibrio hydrothermalis]|uniref:Uncharacterized protein n=1 Tax=Maridesulfovibrio hydrothermalis AM13 = DSM 14728 TaxID=1121451 RepID=L0RI83_9BACT|nr:hypothetical protein [Maridesulfovibrio hydrothermalis]CCO25326.1 conserved protein of unknown function [Maridesulfovibrio hydrothermalis AM13 = DSM 14728]